MEILHKNFDGFYLLNQQVEIEGYKFFGMPFICNEYKTDIYFDEVPGDTDILISHEPPLGILDLVNNQREQLNIGC